MKAVNFSELRQNLKSNLDAVANDNELLIVHRPKGKSIVMMPLEEFNAWQETLYLLKSNANRQRLEEAIEDLKEKKNILKHPLIE